MSATIDLGTQGWNYPAWVGPFYPPGTRSAEMLGVYARAFTTVEVDSTFYAIPSEPVVRGWAAKVPAGFTFALKLPREITHERRLVDCEGELSLFLERSRLLGPKLGPLLIQLGPDLGPENRSTLERFLERLPRDLRFAIEFRRAGWLEAAVLELLAGHGVALALVDGRWLRRERMIELAAHPTADFAYVRWMGPNRRITDYSSVQVGRDRELGMWALALAALAARVQAVYGYFNNHFQGHSPASARQLQAMIGQKPVEPSDLGEQTSLF